MAKRSPIFRNSDAGVNAERAVSTRAARRIALDLQEVIHQLDVSLLKVRERGPRQPVICFKFDDFVSVFYRREDVGREAMKRAWERWKQAVRLYAPGVELRSMTLDKADFCIDVVATRSWTDDALMDVSDMEPDDERRIVVRARRTLSPRPEPESESLPEPHPVEVDDPTDEDVDQRASACVERCRSGAKAVLLREAQREAQREADREVHPDLSRHRFRSASGGGRPSKDAACAVCGRPWRVHPITLAVPGARKDY